jgi:ATP-binding cassette subfamily B protein
MSSYRRDRSVTKQKLRPGTIRRIIEFARPHRRTLAVFVAIITVDAAVGAVNPLIFKAIIDEGILKRRTGLITVLAAAVAALAIFDAVLSLAQRWYSSRIGEGLIYDMRTAVFDHVQRQPLAFFVRTQTGALISRLNNDVLGAQSAFTGTLSSVFSNVLSVGFVLGAMFTLSWQITLVALVLLPLFIIPARLLAPRLASLTRESYGLNAAMNTTMTERFNVAGAMLSKLYGRPDTEATEFSSRAARVRDIGVTQAMYGRIFFVSLTLVASLATAITYGVGGRMAAEGTLQVGTVVALTAYLGRLYGPLTQLSNVNVDIMTALVSFERVFEVLDLAPSIADKPGAVDLPHGAPASVSFEHVDFRYPAADEVSLASLESVAVLDTRVPAPVLRDVSFTVAPGELVALVGPSGAGKTTISTLVPRLYDVTSGSVRVGGEDVRDLTAASLRDAVGVVTQDAHLFHDSVRANLLFARPDADEPAMWAALDAANVGDLVRSLPDGLDTVVGDRGHRLSGGEKQRLAIARLLLKEPSVVVLDEATAHLDSESELAVQNALATALAGRTSLVIAHRLSTVRDADRILTIVDGRVAEEGTHEELLARAGLYADLYRTQFATQEPATQEPASRDAGVEHAYELAVPVPASNSAPAALSPRPGPAGGVSLAASKPPEDAVDGAPDRPESAALR